MKKVTLGSSNQEVSAVCFGTLPFGTKVSKNDSFSLLDSYFEAGGSFLDTANNYSLWHNNGKGGESETVLGHWMKDRRNRDDIFLATKAGFNDDTIGISLSRKTIISEVDKSLQRLQTDYVDLFYSHTDSREDALEETLETYDELVASGKIRFIGCSNYRAWRIQKALEISDSNSWPSYCCIQQRHTFLRPKPTANFGGQLSSNEDLLDFCKENEHVRMLAYAPLLRGSYSIAERPIPEQYHTTEMKKKLEDLHTIANDTGSTVNQVIYAWMMQSNPSIIPLIAPTKLDQLHHTLGCLEVNLAAEQMDILNS